jgi:putative MATE family efflux protein
MSLERSRQRILEAPLLPALLGFGLPLALGMGLQVTFNLVDAYLVSRLAPGEAGPALGAIGICDQLAAVGSIISFGYTTAAATLMSHRQGRGDDVGARRIAWQSTWIVAALGLLFAFLGLFGSPFLMTNVIGAQGRVRELGIEYLRVIVSGNITIFLLLHLTSLQRALGSSKTPVLLLALSNVINLVLAVLLVFGDGPAPAAFGWGPAIAGALHIPRMGLVGAAWATVLARIVILFPLGIIVVKRFGFFSAETRAPFDRSLERELWRLGWPSSTQLVVRIAAMLAIQSLVARAYTTDGDQSATTALGVVFRLETMALFIGLGWGSATQTFVGQNLGARNLPRARRSAWLATGFNALMMGLLSLLYFAYGPHIVRFFDSEPMVVHISQQYMQTVGPSYIGLGIGIVLGAALQAAGRPHLTLLLDLLVLGGILLPQAVVVTLRQGSLSAMFWAISIAYLAFALVYGLVYSRARFAQRLGT